MERVTSPPPPPLTMTITHPMNTMPPELTLTLTGIRKEDQKKMIPFPPTYAMRNGIPGRCTPWGGRSQSLTISRIALIGGPPRLGLTCYVGNNIPLVRVGVIVFVSDYYGKNGVYNIVREGGWGGYHDSDDEIFPKSVSQH